MSNFSFTFQDESFNFNLAGQYTLLMQLLPGGDATLAITRQNKLVAYSDHVSLTDEALNEVLNAYYQQTVIGIPADTFMLVPSVIFDDEKGTDFARMLNPEAIEKVLVQELDNDNHIISKTKESVISALPGQFRLNKTTYAYKGWVSANMVNASAANKLFIDIAASKVQVLNFADYKVRYYNQFEFNNDDELVYFITLAAHELGLDASSATLLVSGEVASGDNRWNRLARFYPQTEMNTANVLTLPGELESARILSLASLYLCASSVAV